MLEVSVPIAHELLAQCVKQAQALVQRASLVGDFSDYESWKSARAQWIEPTTQALEHMYGGDEQAREFASIATPADGAQRWQQQYATDLDSVKAAVEFLTMLQGELAFTPKAPDSGLTQSPQLPAADDGGAVESNGAGSEQSVAAQQAAQPQARTQPQPARTAAASAVEDERSAAEPASERDEERSERESNRLPAPVLVAETEQEPEILARRAEPAAVQSVPALATDGEMRVDPPSREAPSSSEVSKSPLVGASLAQHTNGSVPAEQTSTVGRLPSQGRQVFLAHGRNELWKRAVAHLLEHAGSDEITILNERPSERGTLVEQIGEHAPGSHYGIVLLTADDVGAPRNESEAEPYFSSRAHQGVVFEMGFLVAALTPGCVCVLYEDGVELPCDLDGIAYVRLDLAGTWQPKLLLQLRKAGFDYDLNKLVSV
jgi:predicted nucleotide-binding protein